MALHGAFGVRHDVSDSEAAEDERNADEHEQHAQPAGHEDGERDEAQQVDPPACEQVGAVAQCLAWGPAELAVRLRAGGVRGDRGCDVWSAHLFDAMERHGGTTILPAGFLTVGKPDMPARRGRDALSEHARKDLALDTRECQPWRRSKEV